MPPKHIIFLDAGTVDWKDTPLTAIARLGKFKSYTETPPKKIISRSRGSDILVINKCKMSREVLSKLPRLRLICLAATGTNNVDLEAAKKLGIAVTNVSGYSTESVVQFTFTFLLALAGNLIAYNEAAHDGRWSRSHFFTFPHFPFEEIAGKTLGIIGYGQIGKRVAQVAKVLGMNVLVAKIPGRNYPRSPSPKRVALDFLLRNSDYVTLHAPLTPLTQNLINAKTLKKMKKRAALINMARGGLVDEKALYRALKTRHLKGAAADVLTQEPPPKNHGLLKAPHFLLTPHVAWASREARRRVIHEIALNIKAFLAGKKRNRVV